MGGTLVNAAARRAPYGLSNRTERDYAAHMTDKHARLFAIFTAILVAAAMRLIPHPPNLTPIGAMALFGGAYFGRQALAFVAPLAALLLSDLIIGFYPGMLFTYLAVALVVTIGWLVRRRLTALTVAGAAIASSIVFFIISNFGAWISTGMYPHTLAGLAACYVAAIPFFQNTVAGDLLFSALLFGGFALLERQVPRLRDPALQPA